MNVHVTPIISQLHGSKVFQESMDMLNMIRQESSFHIEISTIQDLYDSDIALILVQSGGSEAQFLKILPKLKTPIYLLTYGGNNSLAASMEILSYLQLHHYPSEILHGSISGIIERLREINSLKTIPEIRLGVIGKPSDWLIASHVDYALCKQKYGIDLIDIDMQELLDSYSQSSSFDFHDDVKLDYIQSELNSSKQLSVALDKLILKYQLSGLTIRCFDLLESIHTTGCIGLSLLNKRGFIGTCEGDIPSMISMYLIKKITSQSSFQANPSRIDTENHTVLFAHCTIPIDMVEDYSLTTHFESGIGVAVKGILKKQAVTIFKISSDLQHYYVEEGMITQIPNLPNLCRTQMVISLPDTSYFLKSPFGNHHIILMGHHRAKIDEYMRQL